MLAISAAALGVAAALPSGKQVRHRTRCAPFHLVYARATLDPVGYGAVGDALIKDLRALQGGAESAKRFSTYAVDYPATTDFWPSAQAGAQDLAKHLEAQALRCPVQKFLLGGYSQGGMVVHQSSLLLDDALKQRVVGATTFGDPMKGMWLPLADTTGYKSFCEPLDLLCTGPFGMIITPAHGNYMRNGMIPQAAQFLSDRMNL